MGFPVFKAFAAGLAYFFTHFLTILRILWLPVLLMMALNVYLMPGMMEAQISFLEIDPEADPGAVFEAMGPMWKAVGAIYLAAAIFYPMMIAGVLKHITRGEAPRLPFYLQFGGDELRIVLATVLLFLLTTVIYAVGAIGFLAVGFAISALSEQLGAIAIAIGALAFFFGIIWFMVRMSLIYAAGVGERKIGIAESWNLTRGSYWALMLYWSLWIVVMVVVSFAYILSLMPGYLPLFMEMMTAAADPAASSDVQRRMFELQQGMWDLSRPGAWAFLAMGYIGTMIYVAFWSVPPGIAYRFLSDPNR